MSRFIRIFACTLLWTGLAAGCSGGDDGKDPVRPDADTRPDGGELSDTNGDRDAADLDGSTDADTPDVDGRTQPDGEGDTTDVDGGDSSDGGPTCKLDKQCGGNAVCEDGECRVYTVVQIRDLTQSRTDDFEEACGDGPSGADLFELELQGPFGSALGYAKALKTNLKSSSNTNASTVFDGTSNSLKQSGDALCPSAGFESNSVLSLGCGGTMLVVFQNSNSDLLYLGGGQQLQVHEYGNQCCEGGCPKEYWEIRVCSAESPQDFQQKDPDVNGIYPTCSTDVLGVGHGHGSVTIQLPRP